MNRRWAISYQIAGQRRLQPFCCLNARSAADAVAQGAYRIELSSPISASFAVFAFLWADLDQAAREDFTKRRAR